MESQFGNSNRNLHVVSGGFSGLTNRFGMYPGRQAECLRVHYENFTPFLFPKSSKHAAEAGLFLFLMFCRRLIGRKVTQ
ncbi:hypothetical protein [Sporosarcina sp. 6E9]|uniref:hypothetical protein n=1 Tax=Sporosarcina sp. 6E9 TaxID=2819235 RepID=UPI001B3014AB|nr:hypothetical protein [Sporosarcina sp. 6E9]